MCISVGVQSCGCVDVWMYECVGIYIYIYIYICVCVCGLLVHVDTQINKINSIECAARARIPVVVLLHAGPFISLPEQGQTAGANLLPVRRYYYYYYY